MRDFRTNEMANTTAANALVAATEYANASKKDIGAPTANGRIRGIGTRSPGPNMESGKGPGAKSNPHITPNAQNCLHVDQPRERTVRKAHLKPGQMTIRT